MAKILAGLVESLHLRLMFVKRAFHLEVGSIQLRPIRLNEVRLPRGKTLLEICTPGIRISKISAGYQRYNKRISREN